MTPSTHPSAKQKKRGGAAQTFLQKFLVAPYSVWAFVFIVVPLFFVAYYAFTDNNFNFTFANISRFFTSRSLVPGEDGELKEVNTYLVIFMRSLKLAAISTVICLIFGYPMAYIMTKLSPKAQSILMTVIMIPMWMNFLIRTYAWMTILQDTGLLNSFLGLFGSKVNIIGTESAVLIGMVYDYFPYMILPIYSVMVKLDDRLIEAAYDLGCNKVRVFTRVVLPLSLPGVITGIIMVLIPSISTFYISQKLGNGKFYLIGDAIEGQYVANDLHFAAAISLILMVILLVCMALMQRYADKKAMA